MVMPLLAIQDLTPIPLKDQDLTPMPLKDPFSHLFKFDEKTSE